MTSRDLTCVTKRAPMAVITVFELVNDGASKTSLKQHKINMFKRPQQDKQKAEQQIQAEALSVGGFLFCLTVCLSFDLLLYRLLIFFMVSFHF